MKFLCIASFLAAATAVRSIHEGLVTDVQSIPLTCCFVVVPTHTPCLSEQKDTFLRQNKKPACPCFTRQGITKAIKAIKEDVDSVFIRTYVSPDSSTNGATNRGVFIRVFPNGSTPDDWERPWVPDPYVYAWVEGQDNAENPGESFYYCKAAFDLDNFPGGEWELENGGGFPDGDQGPACIEEAKAAIKWLENQKFEQWVYE